MKFESKIVLVVPPTRANSPRPPLGLMYIASCLRKEGYKNVSIVDVKSEAPKEQVINQILNKVYELNPDIIGISCLLTDVSDVLHISKKIKSKFPDSKIIVGGCQPTISPETFICKNSDIDFAVLGEGEETFTELISNINKKDFSDIKGIAYFKNKFTKTQPRPLIEDLDSLPYPAWDLIDMNYYTKPSLYAIRGVLISPFYIFSSRGCPYQCTYCVSSSLYGRKVRFRSYKNVVDEIELLNRRYKIDGFYIYDDAFTIDKKRVNDICREILARKLKIIWGCETRADLLDEENIKLMKKSGCIQIDFGIESGSQRTLDILQKGVTIEQIKKASLLCRKYKIRQLANFMFNTPDETEEDLQKTLNLARWMKADVNVFNITMPYPGSKLADYCKDFTYKDFEKLALRSDYKATLKFIDSNLKLSRHKRDMHIFMEEVHKEFPESWDFSFKFNLSYIRRLFRTVSFLKRPKYWKALIYSKRKPHYLKWGLKTAPLFVNNIFFRKKEALH